MKVSTVLRIRVAFGVLATTLGLLVLSGCSGGWGENKPALTIQQGQSQTVTVGQSAIFTVTATGVGPFTYQWYLNGVAINSATSSSYNTGPTVISMNGSVYTVKVTNAAGNEMSAPLDLAVTPLVPTLTFSSIPAETYGNAPFPVTASSASSGAVTYALTAGQTSAGTVSSSGTVTITGAGTIYLTATQAANGNYAAATATTSFAVAASAPVITVQPISKNVCSGYNPSLTISATNATTYQWYFGAATIGTNSPTLTFSDVTSASNGSYSCQVSNPTESVTSNTVTLNVMTPTTLTITNNPSSVSVYATQTATFSVAASGTGTLAYQWYTGTPGSGTIITGATSSTYTTGALQTSNSGTTYYATVTDGDCTDTTLTSTTATLTVTDTDTAVPPTIVIQPVGETAAVGGTATFSVTASGPGTLTYQWYRVPYSATEVTTPTAGAAVTGATSSSYMVPGTETAQSNDGDSYYVIVNNGYGTAVSIRAVLAVGAGIQLQISGQPQAQYIPVNSLASYSVTATCTGCIPAYQWYWAAPGSTTFNALSDGAVSSGDLNGATVIGSATSSLTLQNVPVTATAAVFYAVVTSTSDGTTQISGTNPLTSSTAGLFVGSLGTIGNPTSGDGLCNYSSVNWVLNGTKNGVASAGTVSGDVPYQNTGACTIEMTNNLGTEAAAVYWPTLISTAKFTVSYTVAIAHTNGQTPADGFTMILANPSQGATTASMGRTGEGLGANGIPGFVLGFDTYQNGNDDGGALSNTCPQYTGDTTNEACDPISVPYMAVGQGAANLWENPWTFVNGNLDTQSSTDYTAAAFTSATHTYVVTVVNSVMTVTMDGYELFTGTVSLPPVAYLGFTASTGGSMESVTISSLTATVSAP